jgi:DnaJ-class molecular chaperone
VTEPALNLFSFHPCPSCNGTGQKPNPETGYPDYCRVCRGTRLVPYDPDDKTIPY